MTFNGDFIKHHHRLLQLLQACTRVRSLYTTKPLHALTITLGPNPEQPTFLFNNIISLYASLGELPMAHKVFENMPQRTIVSYNSIINSYCRFDHLEEAWGIFCQLKYSGFRPNNFTIAGLLSCASMDLCCGLQLQALSMKNGLFLSDVFVGTALLGLFGRWGFLDEAFQVFDDMPVKSLMTWNSMISLFAHHGFVEDCMLAFCEIARNHCSLSECSFVSVLSGLVCEKHLEFGEQVHCLVIKTGFDNKVSVMNSLISLYAKCLSIHLAERLFEEAGSRDVVTWNTMFNAMAKINQPRKALHYFSKMWLDMNIIKPNQATLLSLISSCADLELSRYGEFVHGQIIIHGLQSDVYVGSALVDYYAKCDRFDDARRCFDNIHEKNVVSWNALILSYANRCSSASMSLLLDMLRFGYRPNEFSFSAVLKASSAVEQQQLHCLIVKMSYENNEYVLSSLISSYGRNGPISNALVLITVYETATAVVPSNIIAGIYNRSGQYHRTLKLLSELEEPDNVSWNIAVAACARNGNYKEVMELFKYMLMAQIHPDNYTYMSILSVCSKTCDLALGSSIHGFLIKTNFSSCDAFVCNTLIDMYGKCGCHESAVKIFNTATNRNLITWTALISALGINGHAHEALERFKEMEDTGLRPDKVAFIAALSACRHSALVKEGTILFEKMVSYGIAPEMDHYHCLVDLLARHGHVKEAEKVISRMPFPPNASILRSFLEGCKRYVIKENQVVGM
ncbi:pentatricopeptide repeat-containing protein At3g58590 [Euphorbia lathyris]|uniref:pentatricopeptide repeat-containing protein At3g58590 n=1 Tax=Euphorbia lathyris TaxID=212925 RepID=UPI003313844A